MAEKLSFGIDTGSSEHASAKTVIELGSTSGVKVRPVTEAMRRAFGNTEVVTKEVNLETKANPYGAETVFAGVTRLATLATVEPATQPDWLQCVIESGVVPTDHIAHNAMTLLQIPGKLSPDNFDQDGRLAFPEGTLVLPTDATLPDTPLTIEDTVFNAHDATIAPDASIQEGAHMSADGTQVTMADGRDVSYPDRAVVMVYDPQTNTTILGVSRGVPFHATYVQRAIGEQHGNVRVAEEWRKDLLASGKLTPEGYVIRDGVATTELFDKQDPQAYATNGALPRAKQISEIVDVVLAQVKKVRA